MPRTPLQVQKAVILALLFRELKTRFGQYRLNYVWALLEPISHVVVLSAVFSLLGRSEYFGIPVPMFIATAIVPYLFFNKTATSCINAVKANKGLFTYRQVRPIDTVYSRLILEALIYFFSYLALLFIAAWIFEYDIGMNNLLGLFYINLMLLLLTLGVSILFLVFGALYPEPMRLIPMIAFRPMYFISGIMFPLYIIPRDYHQYLLWNPILHIVEFNHVYFFSGFKTGDISHMYILTFTIVSLWLGILSYRANWQRLISL